MAELRISPTDAPLAYRRRVRASTLTAFTVRVKETDLLVHACEEIPALTTDLVIKYRRHIEAYIAQVPEFAASLLPLPIREPMHRIVRSMTDAAQCAGVGPMAAVAGAIAQHVGMDLLSLPDGSPEVIIENGGDIFLKTRHAATVGLYAGRSPLSMKIGLRIRSDAAPMAVCTSSGTVGHSLSLGKADAVCVVSRSCALADAAATSVGNRIRSGRDIQKGIAFGRRIEGVMGLVIVCGKEMGLWGDLDLVRL